MKIFTYFRCLSVLLAQVYVYHAHPWYLRRSEEGLEPL